MTWMQQGASQFMGDCLNRLLVSGIVRSSCMLTQEFRFAVKNCACIGLGEYEEGGYHGHAVEVGQDPEDPSPSD